MVDGFVFFVVSSIQFQFVYTDIVIFFLYIVFGDQAIIDWESC